jgi:alcohol dehydrogenase (NADP+)
MHQTVSILLGLSALALSQLFTVPTPPKGTPLNAIPRIGLGTARLRGNTSEVIATAIVNGYRHIDGAYIYGNQKDVGLGIKEGLRRTGLSRQDLWITGKLWTDR